jgi:hypothetical protein
MESVFYGLNNENMNIEYDKDFEKVMNELQTNFGWSNIEILPDSYKDLLNDTIKAVKNCSIPAVVGRSEQLKAFYHYVDMEWANGSLTDNVDDVIDGFKKSL